ncbi:MAG: hypothetical protein ACHQXL_08555, partial [Candidatus Limnocylindrales bacterium]
MSFELQVKSGSVGAGAPVVSALNALARRPSYRAICPSRPEFAVAVRIVNLELGRSATGRAGPRATLGVAPEPWSRTVLVSNRMVIGRFVLVLDWFARRPTLPAACRGAVESVAVKVQV